MSTILFREIVFGPVHSRRLGVSLGVNLLPDDGKVCSFDCIYCECGYNADKRGKNGLPTREAVYNALDDKLKLMVEREKNQMLLPLPVMVNLLASAVRRNNRRYYKFAE